MSHVSKDRWVSRLVFAVCVAVMGLAWQGCLTWKYFLLPGEETIYPVFEDHTLDIRIVNSIYANDFSVFSIDMYTSYRPGDIDSMFIDSYEIVSIDSMSFTLDCDSSIIRPELKPATEWSERRKIDSEENNIRGPYYSWRIQPIHDSCKVMFLRFTATLMYPKTDSVIVSKEIKLTLTRIHDRVPGWEK